MRYVFLAALVLLAGEIHSQEARVLMRVVNTPEPATIDDLRRIHGLYPARLGVRARDTKDLPCSLPHVAVTEPSTLVADPANSLGLSLPGEWREIGRENVGSDFRMPFTRFENAALWRVTVYRVATGSVGASATSTPNGGRLPTEDCEVTQGSSGVIWAFLTEDRNGVPRYTGQGDGVSASGRRYKFSIGAPSRSGRDSLAAFLSMAMNTATPAGQQDHTIARSADTARVASVEARLLDDKTKLDILTAAGLFMKSEIDRGIENYFVSDEMTARVFDRIGSRGAYTRIPLKPEPSCDGSSGLKGTRAAFSLGRIRGDTAEVTFLELCVMRDKHSPDRWPNYGRGRPLRVIKSGDGWKAESTGLFMSF